MAKLTFTGLDGYIAQLEKLRQSACKHFTNIFLNFFTSTLIISHLRYKKNKNTKKREHFMYFLNIICILVV